MRGLIKLIAIGFWLFPICVSSAATHLINISDKSGFEQNGTDGASGNGFVFLSPKYTIGYGATADFGTAFLSPKFFDPRVNLCGHPGVCSVYNASFVAFAMSLDGNVGGFDAAPFDLATMSPLPPTYLGLSQPFAVFCPDLVCPPAEIRLLVTLPSNADGVQFAFQGSSLFIAPPVPEPSTWAMLLIGFAGIVLMGNRVARSATLTT